MATKTNEPTTALATITSAYPVLSGDGAEIIEAMRENLAGEQLSAFDFQRITVPAGGGLFWTLPGDGDAAPERNLDGIIVHTTLERSYWEQSLDASGGGTPPDCSSPDSVIGYGNPGGACESCQFAQFGSDAKGRGQACKQSRAIYLLREGSFLPIVLSVPPSSLAAIKSYLLQLATQARLYNSVVTRFTLVKEKNKDGIEFSRIEAKVIGQLSHEELQRVRQFGASIKETIAATTKRAA